MDIPVELLGEQGILPGSVVAEAFQFLSLKDLPLAVSQLPHLNSCFVSRGGDVSLLHVTLTHPLKLLRLLPSQH